MKTYFVSDDAVSEAIAVTMEPYPHIVLGEGGHKRATWVPLGKRDLQAIVKATAEPCPKRGQSETAFVDQEPHELAVCSNCGTLYGPWRKFPSYSGSYAALHPQSGDIDGPNLLIDVGVVALKDANGPTGKYLIVAPRPGKDNRALVFWSFRSGYRGNATIEADAGVTVIARDVAWHSGQGNLGETAEMLAVLKPGQKLHGWRSGRNVQDTHAVLTYDGKQVTVTLGGEEVEAAMGENVQGDLL